MSVYPFFDDFASLQVQAQHFILVIRVKQQHALVTLVQHGASRCKQLAIEPFNLGNLGDILQLVVAVVCEHANL